MLDMCIRSGMRRTALPISFLWLAGLTACSATGDDYDERAAAPPVLVGEADGASGVEVVGFLRTEAPVSGELASRSERLGFVFFAAAGATVDLEVTQSGSSRDIDTVLSVHGPRAADGNYQTTLATDDDSGYGQHSRIRGLRIEQDGFYLADLALDPTTTAETAQRYRLALTCGDGECPSDRKVGAPGLDIRWSRLSAERQAAYRQAYAVGTARLDGLRAAGSLPASWAVVADIDETVLDNSTYQVERAELGVGYSPASWLSWVRRREATPLPGATELLSRVREMGGIIALVSNRKTVECPDTEANLQAQGVPYDVVLCRTDVSDKGPRFAMVESGTTPAGLPAAEIVLFVGDNIQDFPALSQDLRFMGPEAFADFGSRFIVLPNPMYGSWEKNAE